MKSGNPYVIRHAEGAVVERLNLTDHPVIYLEAAYSGHQPLYDPVEPWEKAEGCFYGCGPEELAERSIVVVARWMVVLVLAGHLGYKVDKHCLPGLEALLDFVVPTRSTFCLLKVAGQAVDPSKPVCVLQMESDLALVCLSNQNNQKLLEVEMIEVALTIAGWEACYFRGNTGGGFHAVLSE